MVQWFSPGVLLGTGLRAGVAALFGRFADPRRLEAFADREGTWFDYSPCGAGSSEQDFWVDYVADVGDGWNPTYAIARAVAGDFAVTWPPSKGDGGEGIAETEQTKRGRLLIFGGDLVYPAASRKAYEERLVQPYEAALTSRAPHPDLFAVPGNHDWYDSLVAFQRRFCTDEGRWLGGWRTRQNRSYFALKLPHRWWLLGTDVQLGSDIDTAQKRYFEQIAELMDGDDRIILCTPEPHWTYEATAPASEGVSQSNLHCLEEILGQRVRVFLAGDKHHYRRHALREANGKIARHKITAGGGGAFLHPTHNGDRKLRKIGNGEGTEHYLCEKTYPAPRTTRLLGLNLLWAFPIKNPTFGIITAVLYLVTCATFRAHVGHLGWGELGTVLAVEKDAFLRSPSACLWTLLLWLGAVTFIQSDRWWYRWGAGAVHALLHIVAAGLVGWLAAHLAHPISGSGMSWPMRAAIIFAGGWVVGSLVLGFYLGISISVFGRHGNDAFAALAVQDYKNFLRLKISPGGRLRIYPIKLHRVQRRRGWAEQGGATRRDPLVSPPSPDTMPDLIEKWIDVE